VKLPPLVFPARTRILPEMSTNPPTEKVRRKVTTSRRVRPTRRPFLTTRRRKARRQRGRRRRRSPKHRRAVLEPAQSHRRFDQQGFSINFRQRKPSTTSPEVRPFSTKVGSTSARKCSTASIKGSTRCR